MNNAINVEAKKDYTIIVTFLDGEIVLYDMKPLFDLIPSFRKLKNEMDLFCALELTSDGSMIYWDDAINLDTETIWENGIHIECVKRKDTKHLLAYAIQEARIQADLTQKELAEKTGICQADISKLERGLANPSVSTLERIAEGLGKELVIDLKDPDC